MLTNQLLWKELCHRKGNSLLALAVVTTIVALIVATMLLSDGYKSELLSM